MATSIFFKFPTAGYVTLGVLLLTTLVTTTSQAASYSLPGAAGRAPFRSCSLSGDTLTCTGNVSLSNSDTITITQNLTLAISGDLWAGTNLAINTANSYLLNIVVGGTLQIGDNATINANLSIEGNANFGENTAIEGNLEANQIYLSAYSSVVGTCVGLNPLDLSTYCSSTSEVPLPNIEYRFEEASWSGSSGEVIDNSGFGQHATADAGTNTSTTADGAVCRAANLLANRQHIDTPGLAILEGTSSLSFWIKTTQTGRTYNWASPALTGIEIVGRENDIFWGWINGSGKIGMGQGNDRTSLSNNIISTGSYHHVVLTYNSSAIANNVVIYVNGEPNHTATTGVRAIGRSFNQLGYVDRNGGITNSLNALIDEVLIFDQILTAAEVKTIYNLQSAGNNLDGTSRDCLQVLDHFDIDERDNVTDSSATTAAAINCSPEAIRIFARQDDDSLMTDFNGTVSLEAWNSSTNALTGTWSYTGSGSFTNLGTGRAEVTFSNGAIGDTSAELFLQVLDPQQVSIQATYGSFSETSGMASAGDDPTFTFESSGLIVAATENGSSLGAVEVTAGTPTPSNTLFIRAVESDQVTGTCTALFNGNVDLTMTRDCVNPSTCAAGQDIDFIQGATSTPLTDEGTSTAIATNFVDGVASYQVLIDDLGVHEHQLSATLSDSSGNTALSTSVQYFAKPHTIAISSRTNSLGSELDPTSPTVNSAIAGSDINVTITATDANDNAYASFHRVDADTSTAAVDYATVTWSASLLTPTTGIGGTLSGGSSWTDANGMRSTTLQYDELTSLTLTGYMADFWSGQGISPASFSFSADVGNFTPAYLKITNTTGLSATWSTEFAEVYQGSTSTLSDLKVDLTAYDNNGKALQNYDNSAPSLSGGDDLLQKPATAENAGGVLTSRLSWALNDNVDDEVLSLVGTLDMIWTRKSTATSDDYRQQISSFGLQPSALNDADGTCLKTAADAACQSDVLTIDVDPQWLSFARLSMPAQVTAYSAQANIPLTLEVLTNDNGATAFTTATAENFLGLASDQIVGLSYLGGVCTLTTGCPSNGSLPQADVSLFNLSDSTTTLNAGRGYLSYAPSTAGTGLLAVSSDVPSWLYWDWNNDGNSEAPSTLLMYGDYQGTPPLLFSYPGSR